MSTVLAFRPSPDPEDPHAELLARFTEYLIGEGMSPRTIRVRLHYLRRSLEWFDERGRSLLEATPIELAELGEVWTDRSSKMQVRATLGHFYALEGRLHPPTKAIRVPRKGAMRSKALTEDQAKAIARTARGWHPEGTAVMFGLYLALRVSEIARARWDRFDPGREFYTVDGAKSGGLATLPVHPRLREVLDRADAARQLNPRTRESRYVFPGHGREYVTEATVWNWTKKVAGAAGIDPRAMHTHRLRHTALATMNDAVGDLRAVSEFARHASLETTRGYTRTTVNALERVMGALDFD